MIISVVARLLTKAGPSAFKAASLSLSSDHTRKQATYIESLLLQYMIALLFFIWTVYS